MPQDPTHAGQLLGARLAKLSELQSIDSIGAVAIQRVAAELQRTIPKLFDSPALKIARAIVDRLISPSMVGEIAVITMQKAKKPGGLHVPPAGYFVGAIKREFAKAGIPWER
jgi:hypothetical protein